MPRYRFSDFTLSTRKRLLTRNGQQLPLIPRYLDLLIFLIERRRDAVHRREIFDRVGRFDERFSFEYEETEWEDRARSRGLALQFVPASRVRHIWGSSATELGERAARRLVSRRLYWRRRYGRLGRAILDRAARRSAAAAPAAIAQPRLSARDGAWVAVSTNPSVLPFAGAPLEEDFELPPEVIECLPHAPLYLRSFRASDGEPLETFVWWKEPA